MIKNNMTEENWQQKTFDLLLAEPWRWLRLGDLFGLIESDIPVHHAIRYATQKKQPEVSISRARWMLFLSTIHRMPIINKDLNRHIWTQQDLIQLRQGSEQCAKCGGIQYAAGWCSKRTICYTCDRPTDNQELAMKSTTDDNNLSTLIERQFAELKRETDTKYEILNQTRQVFDQLHITLSKQDQRNIKLLVDTGEIINSWVDEYRRTLAELYNLQKQQIIITGKLMDQIGGQKPKRDYKKKIRKPLSSTSTSLSNGLTDVIGPIPLVVATSDLLSKDPVEEQEKKSNDHL